MSNSVRLGLPFLAAGQAQKEVTHNEALALIDAGLHASAAAAGVNVPPPTPAAGQCWIVGSAPTGAWADQAGALACWTDGGWRFLPPQEGMAVWLIGEQLWCVHEASGWTTGELRGAKLMIAGEPVVGARQPGVSPPTGGGTVDVEARSAIAAIVERLVAHGLIAA